MPDSVNEPVIRRGARGQIQPSATAEITCTQRAAERLMPVHRRLINDPYARCFIRKGTYKVLCSTRMTARVTLFVFDRLYPGIQALVLLRNLWYEDALANALRDGFMQVVLLGAGYDTTALRLALGSATLFEVDAPPTQKIKREAIRRHNLRSACKVEYVPCDFECDALLMRLRDHGFDPSMRSLIVWYGVSCYLSQAAVHQTVGAVAKLSAPGSRFLWDYIDESVIDGTTAYMGAQRARAAVAKRGEPYSFGLTRQGAEDLLRSSGFDVHDHMTVTDLARRYGGKRGVWCSTDDFAGIIMGVRQERRTCNAP